MFATGLSHPPKEVNSDELETEEICAIFCRPKSRTDRPLPFVYVGEIIMLVSGKLDKLYSTTPDAYFHDMTDVLQKCPVIKVNCDALCGNSNWTVVEYVGNRNSTFKRELKLYVV